MKYTIYEEDHLKIKSKVESRSLLIKILSITYIGITHKPVCCGSLKMLLEKKNHLNETSIIVCRHSHLLCP